MADESPHANSGAKRRAGILDAASTNVDKGLFVVVSRDLIIIAHVLGLIDRGAVGTLADLRTHFSAGMHL